MTVSPSHEYEMVEMDECMTENEIENRRRVFKLLEKVRLLEEFNKAVVDAGVQCAVERLGLFTGETRHRRVNF